MKLQLHPEAEEELYQQAAWYDEQRPGLGDELLEEIARWLDAIVEAPVTWGTWPGAPDLDPPVRRVLTDRFSFSIGYQLFADHIWVLTFAHTSRRPLYWAVRSPR